MCYMFDAMLLCAYLHILRDNVICSIYYDDNQLVILNVRYLYAF